MMKHDCIRAICENNQTSGQFSYRVNKIFIRKRVFNFYSRNRKLEFPLLVVTAAMECGGVGLAYMYKIQETDASKRCSNKRERE